MRQHALYRCAMLGLGLAQGLLATLANAASPIRLDERVVLFPTAAERSADGQSWVVPIHGWIFEPEEDDTLRGLLMTQLSKSLHLDPKDEAWQLFREPAEPVAFQLPAK